MNKMFGSRRVLLLLLGLVLFIQFSEGDVGPDSSRPVVHKSYNAFPVNESYTVGDLISIPLKTIRDKMAELVPSTKVSFFLIFFEKNYDLFDSKRSDMYEILNGNLDVIYFSIPPVRTSAEYEHTISIVTGISQNDTEVSIASTHSYVFTSTPFKVNGITYSIEGLIGPFQNVFVPYPHALNNEAIHSEVKLIFRPEQLDEKALLTRACPDCKLLWLTTRIPTSPYDGVTSLSVGFEEYRNPNGQGGYFKYDFEDLRQLHGLCTISLLAFRKKDITNPTASIINQHYVSSDTLQTSKYYVLWCSKPIFFFQREDEYLSPEHMVHVSQISGTSGTIPYSMPHIATIGKILEVPSDLQQCGLGLLKSYNSFDCECSKMIFPKKMAFSSNPNSGNGFCFRVTAKSSAYRIHFTMYHKALLYDSVSRYQARDSCIASNNFFVLDHDPTTSGQDTLLCMNLIFNETYWTHILWKTGFVIRLNVYGEDPIFESKPDTCYFADSISIFGTSIQDWRLSRHLVSPFGENINYYPGFDSEYFEDQTTLAHSVVQPHKQDHAADIFAQVKFIIHNKV
jgi:hypothetical protein